MRALTTELVWLFSAIFAQMVLQAIQMHTTTTNKRSFGKSKLSMPTEDTTPHKNISTTELFADWSELPLAEASMGGWQTEAKTELSSSDLSQPVSAAPPCGTSAKAPQCIHSHDGKAIRNK